MQQLSLVTPIQLLYHPQLVLRGEVSATNHLSHCVYAYGVYSCGDW